MQNFKSRYLTGLLQTRVTTEAKNETKDCPDLPRRSWVITQKLAERALLMDQHDIDQGCFPSFACGKFLCYDVNDSSKKPAFLRIYAQLPIDGTEDFGPEIRAKQAASPRQHPELMAFKKLKLMNCDVVPDLLGFQEGRQGDNGFVPGGYIIYLDWEKVRGEHLDEDKFSRLPHEERCKIRAKFREAYPKLMACSVQPCMATMSKLIWDAPSERLYFSGFSRAAVFQPTPEWSDDNYVMYGLDKPSDDLKPSNGSKNGAPAKNGDHIEAGK